MKSSALPQIVECDRWSVIVFSDELMEYVKKTKFHGIHCDKVFYVRKWYSILSKEKQTCSQPAFKDVSQFKVGGKS